MQSTNTPSWLKHLDFIVIDLASLAVSFVLAYWLKFDDLGFVVSSSWKALFAMLLLANLAITLATGPYSGIFRRSYWEDVGAFFKLALWSFLAACVAFYLLKIGEAYSREMLVTTYVTYLLLSFALKAAWKKWMLSHGHKRPADSVRRVVLVTQQASAEKVEAAALADDMASLQVVGFCFTDVAANASTWESATDEAGSNTTRNVANSSGGKAGERVMFANRLVAAPQQLSALAARVNADEVLVTVDPALIGAEVFEALVEDGIRVRLSVEEALGIASESQSLGRAGVMKTLDLQRYSFGSGQLLYLPIKRAFDILLGLIGCVVALIVMVFVKIAYLITGDAHPVIYSQERIGLRGKPFRLWKFRSMVWNADEVLQELLQDPKLRAQWDRDQKFDDDPRITGVGRFLRRTSLDEFPQFFNVLKGDMSVVGPRPLVPGELEDHGGRALYNKVKPGITGWWGCNGRSNIEYRERLELEYHYVKHCSLYLDVLCVFRTFVAVLKKDGAV